MSSLVPFHQPPLRGSKSPPTLNLAGIDEQPAWTDPVSARLFRDMRMMFGGTRRQIASHLGTTEDVVTALETGRLRALPPWPMTQRIVSAYGRLLNLDMAPALARIRLQTVSADPVLPDHELPRILSRAARLPREQRLLLPHPAKPRGRKLRLLSTVIPVLLASILIVVPHLPGTFAEARISILPTGIAAAVDALYGRWADRISDTLVWIDVSDPQTRKSDKLRLAPR